MSSYSDRPSSFEDALDSQADYEARSFVPTEKFQAEAIKLRFEFDGSKFRALCKTAIAQGLTSVQELEEKFPGAIPRNADKTHKKWPLPSPAIQRDIVSFFTTLQNAQGSRKAWRHASPRPKEERTPQL